MIQYSADLTMTVPTIFPYIDILGQLFQDNQFLAKKIEKINNQLSDMEKTEDLLENSLGFGLSLSIDEAIKNAMQHGNKGILEKLVTVKYTITNDRLIISVKDQGDGFDVAAMPDSFDLEKETGRGLLLIKNYMDKVVFNEKGNEITMIKKLKQKKVALP